MTIKEVCKEARVNSYLIEKNWAESDPETVKTLKEIEKVLKNHKNIKTSA
jgi:hypothetical protein